MEALAVARAAYAERRWSAAREGFVVAAREVPLHPDDLTALASAAWWLGFIDESIEVGTQAYERYLEAAAVPRAAMRAFEVAYAYFIRGEGAVGGGWVSRAQRLLAGRPDCAEQGYLLYFEVECSLDGGAETIAKARQVQGFGRRHADRNLVAAGMVGEGRALVKLGRAQEGVGLLDEAMLEASAEDMAPNWAGNIYCHLMAACHELGDIGRAAAWTRSTAAWCERMAPAVLFKGICRVHRAQVMQVRGAWTEAEDEAERVCLDVAHIHVGTVAEACYQIGEIRRLRGDLDAADSAYARGHGLGRDPQPGLALLRLAQGRPDAAASAIRTALAGATDRLTRARLLAAQVEIALAIGDAALAAAAADELDDVAAAYRSSGLQAAARRARGSVLLAAGRAEEALGVLWSACTGWTELEAPYDCAKVRVLLASAYRLLGDTESADRELATARSCFEGLGAVLDARAAGGPAPPGEPCPTPPAGPPAPSVRSLAPRSLAPLTAREAEVLALVAAGRTNRQVAAELVLSEKTVARHLSNIYAKLGVATRTEAARFAYEHGVFPA